MSSSPMWLRDSKECDETLYYPNTELKDAPPISLTKRQQTSSRIKATAELFRILPKS